MNWTGGRLQRHQKNAGGGVASRQKQHFAKVRSQLQNGSRPGHVPFRPSFLQEDDLTLGGILPPFSERSSRHVGHSKKHRRGSKRNRTGGSSEDDGSERRDHTVSPTVGPVTGVPDQDNTRKGKATMKRPASHVLPEDEALEVSRKRLLARRDWLGLESSHPVHMKFRTRAEKERIGKRRKTAHTIRRSHATEGPKDILPPGQGFEEEHRRLNVEPPHEASRDHLRVRIGTDAFVSQRSSTHIRESLRRESSDTMLFEVTRHADTVVRTEPPPEHLEEQYSFAGASQHARHGTAFDYDNHASADPAMHSQSVMEGTQETQPSADLLEELHAQHEHHEGGDSRQDELHERSATHLNHAPPANGRLIFQSPYLPLLEPTQPTAVDLISGATKMTTPDSRTKLPKQHDTADEDPWEHQIADELFWKRASGMPSDDDGRSQSWTSGSAERAVLHEAEASSGGLRKAMRGLTDINAAVIPIGTHPRAVTWATAQQNYGKIAQELTIHQKRTRPPPDEKHDNGNGTWKNFILSSRSSAASSREHEAMEGGGFDLPVHSARGTSMKALYSSTIQVKPTSSFSAASQSAASPRLGTQAAWGQSEDSKKFRAADAASSSASSEIMLIGSPVAAAYENLRPSNYANSEVSMTVVSCETQKVPRRDMRVYAR